MTNSDFRRSTSPDRLRKLAARLTAHGLEVPAEIAEHLSTLDRLDANPPARVDAGDLTAAYLAGKPVKDIDRLALLEVTGATRRNAWGEARIQAAQAGLRALPGYGNDLTAQLAALAAPLIEAVTKTAKVETHDIAALMRAGRTDEAHLVAAFETTCGELQDLYDLRSRVTSGADWGNTPELDRATGYRGATCAVWRDPRGVSKPAPAVEQWRDGVRNGGELWFPLPHEAEARAREITAEIAAEERRAAAEEAGRGYNTGLAGPRARVVTV